MMTVYTLMFYTNEVPNGSKSNLDLAFAIQTPV